MFRLSLILLSIVALASRPLQAASPAVDQRPRPNIVFLFADDQCFDTIRALGNPEIQTPHLDRLVRRGTTFTHAYNMGSWSGAVCVASRTMLNSGRFLWNAKAIHATSEQERKQGRWWGEYMKDAGYQTYMTGKWHCRADAKKSFDVVRDVRPGMPNQTEAGYDRPAADGSDPWSPSDPKFGGFWKGGTHWSQVVANHAADFIKDAASQPKPFFMYLAFNAPHDPRQSPAEYVSRYPLEKVAVPDNFLPVYPYAEAMGAGKRLRDERLAPFPRTPHAVKVHRQEYYAIITHMDAMIGQILDQLEATGKADNTWIFFTADHGLAVGQHGLMGKQNLYDHSVRVPFLVVGPDVEQGGKIDEPIYLQDVMPTTLQLADVDKPEHVEFQSLLPLLDGQPSRYQSIYGAYLERQRSIRTDRYKLIVYPQADTVRLYDIQNDPLEREDLAGDATQQEVVAELLKQLMQLQEHMHDEVDLAALVDSVVVAK